MEVLLPFAFSTLHNFVSNVNIPQWKLNSFSVTWALDFHTTASNFDASLAHMPLSLVCSDNPNRYTVADILLSCFQHVTQLRQLLIKSIHDELL